MSELFGQFNLGQIGSLQHSTAPFTLRYNPRQFLIPAPEYPMADVSRRQKIEAMLADEPHDPFLRYCLANELQKEGEHEPALELLRGLMQAQPPHVASFFRAGQMLASLARVEEARAALRSGIDAARAQGDSHAAGEMSEFLASLGALGE
jgi:predicted Zn-dependent protease